LEAHHVIAAMMLPKMTGFPIIASLLLFAAGLTGAQQRGSLQVDLDSAGMHFHRSFLHAKPLAPVSRPFF